MLHTVHESLQAVTIRMHTARNVKENMHNIKEGEGAVYSRILVDTNSISI